MIISSMLLTRETAAAIASTVSLGGAWAPPAVSPAHDRHLLRWTLRFHRRSPTLLGLRLTWTAVGMYPVRVGPAAVHLAVAVLVSVAV